MRSDEAILDEIIKDGSVHISEWPELLKRLLTRLEHIAHNSFPTPPPASNPAAPSTIPASNPTTQSTAPDASDPSSNPAPAPTDPPSNDLTTIPDAPATTAATTTTSPTPMAPPPPTSTLPTNTNTDPISPDDLATLTQLTTILTINFPTAPPYTIQRLAELLRNPTAHYRSLTKYLRALTRVLSVSSPATVFPLEDAAGGAGGAHGAPNGAAFMLGSDESLGGALLSPIPWLTPTPLSDETAAVPQGALMRAEQELGIVAEGGGAGETAGAGGAPPPLGPEDVGPQPEGTVFEDPPGVEEMGRVEEMRDASVEREEAAAAAAGREESLEDKMQLDAAADGKEEEEARREREKENAVEGEKKEGEGEGEGEESKDEKMTEA